VPEAVVSKHRQIEQALRGLIESGRLQPGESLPSELKLAAEHGVSAGTVRRALSTLIHEGILKPRRRSGVYVQEKPRQKIIGVMVPNVDNPDHARLVEAVTQGAAERGYSPVLFCASKDWRNYQNDKMPQVHFVERLAAMAPMGIIACPTHVPDEELTRARMRELKIPYVITNDYWTDCRRDRHVCADQEAAVRMAVDLLAELGHRKMTMWMVPGDEWPAAGKAFLEQVNYRSGFGQVNLSDDPATWVAQFLAPEGREKPTAVIVPYYEQAQHLLGVLESAGVRVPEDLSLVCLGGLPVPKPHEVDLTATISPLREVAARALSILIDDTEESTCHYRYMPTLHVGATTAPAAPDKSPAGTKPVLVSLQR